MFHYNNLPSICCTELDKFVTIVSCTRYVIGVMKILDKRGYCIRYYSWNQYLLLIKYNSGLILVTITFENLYPTFYCYDRAYLQENSSSYAPWE